MIRFSLAVAVVGFFPTLPSLWLAVGIPLLAILCSQFVIKLKPAVPALLGLLWGLAYGYWGEAHKLPYEWQGEDLSVRGVVSGLPVKKGNQCRFELDIRTLVAAEANSPPLAFTNKPLPRRIRLSHYHCDDSYLPGDHLEMTVRLKRPRGYRNPGSFDSEARDFSYGIDAVGYVRSVRQIRRSTSAGFRMDQLRWRISDAIEDASMATDTAYVSVLQALLIGDKRAIEWPQWQLYRNTGVVHLLVISGLHIGLICGAVFGCLMLLGRLVPNTSLNLRIQIAIAGALGASLLYALIAGFTLPTQRALIMIWVLFGGWLLQRRVGAVTRLKIALATVLVIDPLAHLSAGFWLSFGAAALLLYILCGRLRNRGGMFVQLSRIQISIMLIMIPLLAYQFYQVPLISPLVNLIAVPVVSFFVLPLSMVSMLLLPISPSISAEGFWLSGQVLDLGTDFLYWMDRHLNYIWEPPSTDVLGVLLAVVGALILLLPAAVPGRWLGVLMYLPLIVGAEKQLPTGVFRLTTLDVGQGLSVVVETREHTLLYDTGKSFPGGYSLAGAVVEPFLKSRGIRELDMLVVSHGDNDHAGGAEYILRQFRPREVKSSVKLEGISGTKCSAGQKWSWDGVDFLVLHPGSTSELNSNNRSCVVKITGTFGSALLTGDIESLVEEDLVKTKAEQLQASVLIVPHHGSKSSSSEQFLDWVNPEVAIISSGYRNRFGHPHKMVVDRIQQRDVDLYRTDVSGAVSLRFESPEPLLPKQYAIENRHYWWN